MKPYVVIIKQIKDNKIILSEDELKSIVERAYNDGYNDGNRYWFNNPSITYTYNNNPLTTDHTIGPLYDGITITCNNTEGEKEI